MFSNINPTWTIFLDRDGVINHEKKEDYIRNSNEFVMYDEVPEAIKILSAIFSTIVIVTNQKGVGRGLMTVADLEGIHNYMTKTIVDNGGRIDKIYYCTDIDNNSPNRKPQHGMALKAQQDFPHIDFTKSLMVGNKMSDMQFGRNAGMHTVFLATTNPETAFPDAAIDFRFDNLLAFANAVQQAMLS